MSNVIFGGQGIHSAGSNINKGNLGNMQMSAGGQSLFNMDGSNNNNNSSNTQQGGNNSMGLGMWNTTGTQGTTVQNQGVQNNNTTAPGGWQVDGQVNVNNTGVQPGFDTVNLNGQAGNVGASGVKWGNQVFAQNNVANGTCQYDVVAAAKEAVKNLGAKLLAMVPNLNNEEFNEMVKLFDLVGAKDEFLQMSGRKDSYLDRQLLTEAINELNTTFIENNQKNAELTNTLNSIAQVLNNTGAYDAGNVYKFINNAILAGAIPAAIKNDPGRSNLVKVVNMALAYKNNGGASGIGASGVNWGGMQQQQSGGLSWGTTSNNMGMWGANNSNIQWGAQQTSFSNPSTAWGINNQVQTQPNQAGFAGTWGQSNVQWGSQQIGNNQGFNVQQNSAMTGVAYDWGNSNGGFNTGFNVNQNVSLGDGTQYSTRRIVGNSGTVGGNGGNIWGGTNQTNVNQQSAGFDWSNFGAQNNGTQAFGTPAGGTPVFIQ